jgi:16S rRNA (uracil1498-N3)-methyltransferase
VHRCLVDSTQWDAPEIRLPPDGERHLLRVLRVRPGDTVSIFDGRGREALAQVVSVAGSSRGSGVFVKRLTDAQAPAAGPACRLTLIQALPKGSRMDWIVEKAVELGAWAIWPVLTERVVQRPAADQRAGRAQRWQRIANSAARQCATAWVPEVRPVQDLGAALDACGAFDLFLVGSLADGARPLREVLAAASGRAARNAALLIGPEGDLTEDEHRRAAGAGAVPVSFGALVLRVETAALFGLSVLAYELTTGSCPKGTRSGCASSTSTDSRGE